MRIDLNNPAEITTDNVKRLLGSKDDSEHRQLRVTSAGVAYLSDDVGLDKLNGVATRFETWSAGTGYCGQGAANDPEWVEKITSDLRLIWPDPPFEYIDFDLKLDM